MISAHALWFHCLLGFTSAVRFASAADFGRDIQPILARHCYECHGAEKQKGELRLDERDSALRTGEQAVIISGRPEQSELYRRITLPEGHVDTMPNRGERLNILQTDLIRDWISDGAVWPTNVVLVKHWSYQKPVRPQWPATTNHSWAKNEIDRFILARLNKENLPPSQRANARGYCGAYILI
jgi:hypothetical protein